MLSSLKAATCYSDYSPKSFGILCIRRQIRLQSPTQKNSVPKHDYISPGWGTLFCLDGNYNRICPREQSASKRIWGISSKQDYIQMQNFYLRSDESRMRELPETKQRCLRYCEWHWFSFAMLSFKFCASRFFVSGHALA